MNRIAFAKDDLTRWEAVPGEIASQKHRNGHPPYERSCLTTDLSNAKPFSAAELRLSVNNALAECLAAGFEVVSAVPEWVELRMPCDLETISALEKLLTQLDADLPRDIGESISYACREMLNNAVEYGGRLNPAAHIEVRFVRLKHAVICRIKDPGNGFDPTLLDHSAINNPNHDPLRHAAVREAKGLRAGGFGILLTRQLVDELVYNERHNELLFVKYLS